MRLRFRFGSGVDQSIGRHLHEAEKAIHEAIHDCMTHLRKVSDPLEVRQTRKTIQGLQRTLGALSQVRPVRSQYTVEDEPTSQPTKPGSMSGRNSTPE